MPLYFGTFLSFPDFNVAFDEVRQIAYTILCH